MDTASLPKWAKAVPAIKGLVHTGAAAARGVPALVCSLPGAWRTWELWEPKALEPP